MKVAVFLFTACTLVNVYAQNKVDFSADWAKEDDRYSNGSDILDVIAKQDLSKYWVSDNNSQNGVYGNDYWRIEFYISEVSRDKEHPLVYHVKGKDRHKNNVTPFEGTITITKATRYAVPHEIVENISPMNVVAEYNFIEDPTSKYSGVFTGILRTKFTYEPNAPDVFEFDTEGGDGYMNNTYVGVWTSKSGKQKKCIWGLDWLPYTEDWNEGASDIYVNKKYVKNGWETYMKRLMDDKPVSKKDEWWK
jgi:hypothetical protein